VLLPGYTVNLSFISLCQNRKR